VKVSKRRDDSKKKTSFYTKERGNRAKAIICQQGDKNKEICAGGRSKLKIGKTRISMAMWR